MSNDLIVSEEPHNIDFWVHHGEDWHDPLPQMIDPFTGDPFNLSGVTFSLFARPSLDHPTRFLVLSTIGSGGFVRVNNSEGLLDIFYTQENVEARLPITFQDSAWRQFIRMSFVDDDLGPVDKLFSVGKLYVLPAKLTATPP